MNKQFLILCTIPTFAFSTQAQNIAPSRVPSDILNLFFEHSPRATDVAWKVLGKLYNVDFKMGREIDHGIWYNSEWKTIKHQEIFSKSDLPNTVLNRIQTDFSGYTIDDLERISNHGYKVYKMELN